MRAAKYVGTMLVAATFVMAGGCDEDEGYEGEDQFVEPLPKVVQIEEGPNGEQIVSYRGIINNGKWLNGIRLNGIKLNGIKLNGIKLNGIKLNGIKLNGTKLNNVRWGNGGLRGERDTDAETVDMDDGDEVAVDVENEDIAEDYEMALSEIEYVPSKPFKFQRIRYRVKPAGSFADMCFDNYGNPTKGMLINYTLGDDGVVRTTPADGTVWACRGTAVGKCIEYGFHPDDTGWDPRDGMNRDFFNAFQACTRMIRADYLGTGQEHTENGTQLDVVDRYELLTPDTTWQMESAWGPDGVLCLGTPRRLSHPRAEIVTENGGAIPACGTHDGTEAGRDALIDSWLDAGAEFVVLNVPV